MNNESDLERHRITQLRTVLRFFASAHDDKHGYLPSERFRPVRFHMQTGDFETTYPLKFLAQLATDCCGPCSPESATPAQTQYLWRLDSLITVMLWSRDERLWDPRHCFADRSHFRGVWDIATDLAHSCLDAFSWPIQPPDVSCVQLLNEYGAYSKLNQRA
jgi:hypothetical protein